MNAYRALTVHSVDFKKLHNVKVVHYFDTFVDYWLVTLYLVLSDVNLGFNLVLNLGLSAVFHH